jgi:hypothetical protein
LGFGIWNFPDKPGPFWLKLDRDVRDVDSQEKGRIRFFDDDAEPECGPGV